MSAVLEVSGLKTHFFTHAGVVKAVDGVDFTVSKDEVMGLAQFMLYGAPTLERACTSRVCSVSTMDHFEFVLASWSAFP